MEIVIFDFDDWAWVYKNGVLVGADHTWNNDPKILSVLGIPFVRYSPEVDVEDGLNSPPDKLEEAMKLFPEL